MSKIPTELIEYIYDLDVSTRTRHALLRACHDEIITTIDQLYSNYVSGDLVRIRGIGQLTYFEISNALARNGVSPEIVASGFSRGIKKMQDKVIVWSQEELSS